MTYIDFNEIRDLVLYMLVRGPIQINLVNLKEDSILLLEPLQNNLFKCISSTIETTSMETVEACFHLLANQELRVRELRSLSRDGEFRLNCMKRDVYLKTESYEIIAQYRSLTANIDPRSFQIDMEAV
jgi:hypothetical protein